MKMTQLKTKLFPTIDCPPDCQSGPPDVKATQLNTKFFPAMKVSHKTQLKETNGKRFCSQREVGPALPNPPTPPDLFAPPEPLVQADNFSANFSLDNDFDMEVSDPGIQRSRSPQDNNPSCYEARSALGNPNRDDDAEEETTQLLNGYEPLSRLLDSVDEPEEDAQTGINGNAGLGLGAGEEEELPQYDAELDEGAGEDLPDDFNAADPGQEGISLMEFSAEGFQRECAQLDASVLSEADLTVLKAYAFKIKNNLTEKAFEELQWTFGGVEIPSLKETKTRIQNLSTFKPIRYDCCQNSCVCFAGRYSNMTQCPFCKEDRLRANSKLYKVFQYLPIIPCLQAMVASLVLAMKMRYRGFEHTHDPGKVSDIFDSELYRTLLEQLITINSKTTPRFYFGDPREIALGLSTDGFGPFKSRKQTCWPLILYNYNLPPELRFIKDYILCLGVMPGPKKPHDIDSFLWLFIQEMLKLARGVTAFDANTKKMFVLRAHLLLVIGDIPAVSMVMHMKGQNGQSPCRICSVNSTRAPGSDTLYVPHDRRCLHEPSIDLANLPTRSHNDYISQASAVQNACTDTEAKALATQYGISGLPLLACLGSLSFPHSFAYDFMHLIWENLMKNLMAFWTGTFKFVDHTDQDYLVDKTAWAEIGQLGFDSGKTIPAAFGCRVPNVADKHPHFTAESRTMFTLFVAPTLLREKFKSPRVYNHFTQLVYLLELCMKFDITQTEIDEIDAGFKKWVKDYEKIYFQNRSDRIAACKSTVHSLLHIASSIRNIGPVWATWSFPTERFCGSLLPGVRSRRFPYASLDSHVTAHATLDMVKNLYNLHDALSRKPPDLLDKALQVSEHSLFDLIGKKASVPLPEAHWKVMTKALAHVHGAALKDVERIFPKNLNVTAYRKIRKIHERGIIDARELVPLSEENRDASFIRYSYRVDLNERNRNAPIYVDQNYYGQLLFVFEVTIPASPVLHTTEDSTEHLAMVKQCGPLDERYGLKRYANMGTVRCVYLCQIHHLVGRVLDQDKMYSIIERD